LSRDAPDEALFASAIARPLVGLAPILNKVGETVGVTLEFDGHTLTPKVVGGEVTT
jgi:hypothetical protein